MTSLQLLMVFDLPSLRPRLQVMSEIRGSAGKIGLPLNSPAIVPSASDDIVYGCTSISASANQTGFVPFARLSADIRNFDRKEG